MTRENISFDLAPGSIVMFNSKYRDMRVWSAPPAYITSRTVGKLVHTCPCMILVLCQILPFEDATWYMLVAQGSIIGWILVTDALSVTEKHG